jgi:hypothetical protein
VSETELTAVTPEETEGSEKVIVSDKRGESTESGPKFKFVAPPKPEVSEIEPTEGTDEGGTTVKINGNGFLKGATVTIGAEATSVKVVSENEITAVTAAQTAGEDPVIVTDKHGESTESGPKFKYTTPAAPTASEITPSHGSTEGGTNVVIKGTGFVAGAVVAWEGVLEFTNVVVKSEEEITATSPVFAADETHEGHIYVFESRGTAIGPAFTYEKPATPTVSKIEPTEGTTKGGTKVTIKGSGFLTGATVNLGGAATSVKVVDESEITAVTAAHGAGTVNVDVTDKRGTIDSEVAYKYVKPVEGADVQVTCSSDKTCRGSVSLTAGDTSAGVSAARVSSAGGRQTQLGSATYTIGAGKTAAVHVKLSSAGRALLSSGAADVRAALTVTGQAAKATKFTAAVVVKYGGITGQATVSHAGGGAKFSVGRR